MSKYKEVVIVGGVAAGMSAASKLKRTNKDVRITVFEADEIVSYGACGLPYYVSGLIENREDLIARTPEAFREKDIHVKTKHRVEKVFPEKKTVIVNDLSKNQKFEKKYDALVVATGASPILPPFEGIDKKGIFPLRTIPDADAIKEALKDDSIQNVAIVGAGYIGMEMLESMIELGKKVRLINRSHDIMKPYDEEIREILLEGLKKYNVQMTLGEEVEAFGGQEQVDSVKTNRNTYETDMVIFAIGVKPNSEILEGTGVKRLKNGAIVVDEKMQTNLPDVYSAGDCSAVYHKLLKKHVHIPLGTHANKQGKILGENLGGGDKSFPGVLGTSVVKILDMTLARTGLSEKEAQESDFDFETAYVEAKSHAGYYPEATPIGIKFVFEKRSKRLLGSQMIGKKGVALRIDVMAMAIEAKMSLEDIALMDLCYAPPFAGVWDAVQVAANVADKS